MKGLKGKKGRRRSRGKVCVDSKGGGKENGTGWHEVEEIIHGR